MLQWAMKEGLPYVSDKVEQEALDKDQMEVLTWLLSLRFPLSPSEEEPALDPMSRSVSLEEVLPQATVQRLWG